MNITEERKQEALQLLQQLNETQWLLILKTADAFTHEPTPEEKEAEARHRQELQEAKEAMLATSEATFNAWKQKRLKGGVQIPKRYDVTFPDLQGLLNYATRINPDKEPILKGFCAMFEYGFKQGMAYGKALAKKKAALHAANTKNGLDHSTDEI